MNTAGDMSSGYPFGALDSNGNVYGGDTNASLAQFDVDTKCVLHMNTAPCCNGRQANSDQHSPFRIGAVVTSFAYVGSSK